MGLIRRRVLRLGDAIRRQVSATAVVALAVVAVNVVQALIIARILVAAIRHRELLPVPLLAVLVALLVGRAALLRLGERQAVATAAALRASLRGQLLTKLAELGPAYGLRHRTGSVQATVLDGVDALGAYFGRFIPLLAAATATVVVVVAIIAVIDPITGAIVLACALLVPAAPVITERAFGETSRTFWAGFGRLSAGYLDAIQGMATLRAFHAQARWGSQLLDQSRDLCEDAIGLNALASMHIGFVALGMAAGTAGAVALAALRVTQGGLGITAGVTILLLARECFRPLADLSSALPRAYVAVSASTAVIDLLEAEPEVVEAGVVEAGVVEAGVVEAGVVEAGVVEAGVVEAGVVEAGVVEAGVVEAADPTAGVVSSQESLVPSLSFEDVTFSYQPDRPALSGLSFRVDAGETVALVGRSGAGKSTVVSLLLRFFDPQHGQIRIGGQDISELALRRLRDLVAVSFQDTYLFHRGVADNIRFGRPGATDAEVEAAARDAHAHSFILQLPDGYDTMVGERGIRLSGGERQRMAIARALLADRPILVLDEPTSSVDGESEALIQHALERLTAGRTTLIIAHRLSTIEGADRVVVLESGRAVEVGSPAQLVAAHGAYSRLVQAQELL